MSLSEEAVGLFSEQLDCLDDVARSNAPPEEEIMADPALRMKHGQLSSFVVVAEVVNHVASFLPLESALEAATVNRTWRRAILWDKAESQLPDAMFYKVYEDRNNGPRAIHAGFIIFVICLYVLDSYAATCNDAESVRKRLREPSPPWADDEYPIGVFFHACIDLRPSNLEQARAHTTSQCSVQLWLLLADQLLFQRQGHC